MEIAIRATQKILRRSFYNISLIVFCKIEKPQKSWYSYDGIPSTLKTYQKSTGRRPQDEMVGKCAFDIGS